MRRRGPGVGGLKKRAEVRNAMREKGAELQEDRLQHSQEVLETFRKHLEQFAVKYRESIKSDVRASEGKREKRGRTWERGVGV
jgi:ESCRT-II complex subunit VPS22